MLKTQLLHYWDQVSQLIGIKGLITLLVAALAPQLLTLHVLVFLFCVDFVTGVLVARQMHRLSSAGMRRGLTKLGIYIVFIAIIALAEHAVLGTEIATMGAIGLLVCTELISIVENLVWLGLPVPYASKVLALVSSKTSALGFKTDINDADPSLSYTRDIHDIVQHNIARLAQPNLAQALKIYCAVWYGFIRDIDAELFTGAPELGWARVKVTVGRAQLDFEEALQKSDGKYAGVSGIGGAATAKLLKAIQPLCMAKDVPGDQKVAQVRDQAMLMCYRVVGEIEILDQKPAPSGH